MAAKDNVSAREGVGAVITVHADIKVVWIYITFMTRCKKKRASWREFSLLKERITHKKALKIFKGTNLIQHTHKTNKMMISRRVRNCYALRSQAGKREPGCDGSAIYSGSSSTQNTANSR